MLSNALLQSLNIKGLADDSRRVKPGDFFQERIVLLL